MTRFPEFENYGRYSSDNYGAHTLRFFDGRGNVFWFSYRTLVAFKKAGRPIVVHENDWGPTTGKHLNWIDGGDKKSRASEQMFAALYTEAFGTETEAA